MSSPRVSVVIPAHNRAALLPRAIRSVQAQSLSEFELIVVDDGSTDGTADVVGSFADDRITYLRQPHSGAANARNLGASAATAPILTFLDSDDEALPTWLELLTSKFSDPRVGLVCAGVVQTELVNGVLRETELLPRNDGAAFCDSIVLFLSGSFAVRRELFHEINGYSDRAARQQKELGRRLTAFCVDNGWLVEPIMAPLARWHIHEGARISNDLEAQFRGAAATVHDDRDMLLARSPKLFAKYCSVAGVAALKLGRFREARQFLKESIRHDRRNWKNYPRLALALLPPVARLIWR